MFEHARFGDPFAARVNLVNAANGWRSILRKAKAFRPFKVGENLADFKRVLWPASHGCLVERAKPRRFAPLTCFTSAGPMGWDAFYGAYPKSRGYLRVSAVGFDKAHDHAIVYMAHACGGLCGQAGYHFLERTADGWKGACLDVSTCMVVS
jgi:hypothetical protein